MVVKNNVPEIEVRRSRPEDLGAVIRLLELEGMPRRLAYEKRLLLAERRGEILAMVAYRVDDGRLVLERLISDPFVEARPLATALYAEARRLAWSMNLREVRAGDAGYDDFPGHAGYRRRWRGWVVAREDTGERPAGWLRRMFALWGMQQIPFFRDFRS